MRINTHWRLILYHGGDYNMKNYIYLFIFLFFLSGCLIIDPDTSIRVVNNSGQEVRLLLFSRGKIYPSKIQADEDIRLGNILVKESQLERIELSSEGQNKIVLSRDDLHRYAKMEKRLFIITKGLVIEAKEE